MKIPAAETALKTERAGEALPRKFGSACRGETPEDAARVRQSDTGCFSVRWRVHEAS